MKLSLSFFAALALGFCLPTLARAADPTVEELEAKFIATMKEATMAGTSTSLKDGVLGETKQDKYSIVSVEKIGGSSWVINTRMRGQVMPVPVRVSWAGDAAVIIVENLTVPGGKGYTPSAYTARVMVYEKTYAGTWSGGDHGGMLAGVITNEGK